MSTAKYVVNNKFVICLDFLISIMHKFPSQILVDELTDRECDNN